MSDSFDAGATTSKREQHGFGHVAVERSSAHAATVRIFTGTVGTMAVLGGLATGAALAVAMIAGAPDPAGFEMQQIAAADVADASQSLVPSAAPGLVEEARSCRRPLAFVAIKSVEPAGGTVRFRVGTYVSPPIRLGLKPSRVALPFPEPYASGRGQITVENKTAGIDLFLVPGTKLPSGPGVTVLNVRWDPKAPC